MVSGGAAPVSGGPASTGIILVAPEIDTQCTAYFSSNSTDPVQQSQQVLGAFTGGLSMQHTGFLIQITHLECVSECV